MTGILASEGYEITQNSSTANVWLLNSCTVKNPSQQSFTNDIKDGLDKGKKVIVAGCVPQGDHNNEAWKDLSVIGVQQIDKVAYVVGECLKGNTVKLFQTQKRISKDGRNVKSGFHILMKVVPAWSCLKLEEIHILKLFQLIRDA